MNFERHSFPRAPEPRLDGTELEKKLYYSDAAQEHLNDDAFSKPLSEQASSPESAMSREELNYQLVNQTALHLSEARASLENETNSFQREILKEDILKQEALLEDLLSNVSPKDYEAFLEKNNTL